MKRTISIFLAVVTILLALPIGAVRAAETLPTEEIIWMDDGSYIKVTVQSASTIASSTITKNKNLTYYGSDNSLQWKITLTGTFTYTGETATCTASSCTVTIYNNSWYVVSKSATKSGNKAYATVTMGRKVLGVTVDKQTYNLTLSCDKYGNVS